MKQEEHSLFRKEVVDFRARRLEGSILLATPMTWQITGFGLATLLLFGIAFLALGKYARVEVVSGAVTLDRGIAAIVPSRPGVVDEVLAAEGMHVSKNAPLVAIRTEEDLNGGATAPERSRTALTDQAASLISQQSYLAIAAQANRDSLEGQVQGLTRELELVRSQVAEQERLLTIAEADLARANEIAARGFLSRRDLDAHETEVVTRRQQLAQLEQRAISAASQLAAIKRSIAESSASAASQIQGLRSGRAALERELAETESRQGYLLRAPIGGVATAVTARIGQEAKVGEEMLLVVPDGAKLQAELSVPSSAVGFLEEGQDVRLAIDAYPYQTFGTIHGTISQVSRAGVIRPGSSGGSVVYLVTVDLTQDYIRAFGRRQALLPGMTLTARIVTKRKSLLQWLFDPLYAVGSR